MPWNCPESCLAFCPRFGQRYFHTQERHPFLSQLISSRLWAPLAAHRSQMAAVPIPTAGSSSDHSIYAQPEFHFQRYHFSSLLHFGLFWPNFLYRSIIFVNCHIFCGARRQHNYMLCCVRTEWRMCSGQVPGMYVTYPVTWDWKASRWDSFRTQVLLEYCSNWNLCMLKTMQTKDCLSLKLHSSHSLTSQLCHYSTEAA